MKARFIARARERVEWVKAAVKRFGDAFLSRGYLADVAMAAAGMWLGLLIVFGITDSRAVLGDMLGATTLFCALSGLVMPWFGTGRTVWRWTTADDLKRLAQAVALVTLVFLALLFLNQGLAGANQLFVESAIVDVPRLSPVLGGLMALALMSGARGLARAFSGGGWRALFRSVAENAPAVVFVGPTEAITRAIHSARSRGPLPVRPVAIVSTLGNQQGKVFAGARVFAGLDALEAQVRAAKARNKSVRIALIGDDPGRRAAKAALSVGAQLNVPIMRMADSEVSKLSPVNPSDVLGRLRKELDPGPTRALVSGQRVLVTGAGGTIGSELARQIARFGPAKLTLVELSENNLYQIQCDLVDDHPELPVLARLLDVRDAVRLDELFLAERPQIVVHAAANKHVPLMEDHICDAILVNLGGTKAAADAALKAGSDAFILISTDKAVAPSNVMGAAKRAAEYYVRHCARKARGKFYAVRFGNVLGSSGSVMPRFERQIARGGPITVTHQDMKRWFMTVEEASSLVLQAAAFGATAHDPEGALFVLDMGEPVRIMDLAEAMVLMKGLEPDEDIKIEVTGLRPGEKLEETLFYDTEEVVPTSVEGVLMAQDRVPAPEDLDALVEAALAAAAAGDAGGSMRALRALVPDFVPIPRGH